MADDKEDAAPPPEQMEGENVGASHAVKLVDDDEKAEAASKGGCRQCCSYPHGKNGLIAAIFGTVAWILTVVAVRDCHFLKSNYLYCHPPPPKASQFGSCGDCHCINLDKPCPSDPNEIPLTDMSDDWIKQLRSMKALNPYEMVCNPYQTNNQSCTNPPQDPVQIELWETAVCGMQYNMQTLDADLCPTEYTLITYDTEEDMKEAGAVMTHWGACGACSTAQDLTVYVEYPDLTRKGQECGIRGLVNTTDGINCFKEVGYTPACAEAWMYNVFNTRDHCFDVCIDFTFFGDGANNGPPPECKTANCLLCDEEMSGVIFQTEAARSRRRSGLLSKIARACEVILIVDHEPPCNVTQRKVANGESYSQTSTRRGLQSSKKPDTPEKWRTPEPTETCVFIKEDLGLGGYAGQETSNWLGLPQFLLTTEQKTYESLYATCVRYSFSSVLSGFWQLQRDIFGAAYRAARAFGLMAILIGAICLAFVWASSCVAYAPVFWKWMTGLFAFCGLFCFLTLVFLASEVCQDGCEIGQSAIFAIIAGVIWWVASVFAFLTGPFDPNQPRARTCCMPDVIEDTGAYPGAYKAVPTSEEPERTEISLTETVQSDGSVVVEKLTTYPNGAKTLEVTTKSKGELA